MLPRVVTTLRSGLLPRNRPQELHTLKLTIPLCELDWRAPVHVLQVKPSPVGVQTLQHVYVTLLMPGSAMSPDQ